MLVQEGPRAPEVSQGASMRQRAEGNGGCSLYLYMLRSRRHLYARDTCVRQRIILLLKSRDLYARDHPYYVLELNPVP